MSEAMERLVTDDDIVIARHHYMAGWIAATRRAYPLAELSLAVYVRAETEAAKAYPLPERKSA
jgi:hypothetical protein